MRNTAGNLRTRLSGRGTGIFAAFAVLAAVLLCAGCGDSRADDVESTAEQESVSEAPEEKTMSDEPDRLRRFEPEEFKTFYDDYRYPDAVRLRESPVITGSAAADARIAAIAEKRGYRLRAEGDAETLVEVAGKVLQPPAADAWRALAAAARSVDIELGLVSGYRSVDRQRRIFLDQLSRESRAAAGREYTVEEIAGGTADRVIDGILSTFSIPGYSKHHTGYTIDITDVTSGRDFTDFGETAGFRWISTDNYRNAKLFGFLPSYPEGATEQGPVAEPWEYVWVGEEALRGAQD